MTREILSQEDNKIYMKTSCGEKSQETTRKIHYEMKQYTRWEPNKSPTNLSLVVDLVDQSSLNLPNIGTLFLSRTNEPPNI